MVILLATLGAALGSFAAASVWRLRARQLKYEKEQGLEYDKAEYKTLKPIINKVSKDRSKCLHCSHELSAKDLIPVYSWLSLKGRCRYCKQKIGNFELFSELGLAGFFVLSYIFWPFDLSGTFEILRFATWLVVGVILAIMFAYDFKWFLLPDVLLNALIIIGLANSLAIFSQSGFELGTLYSILGGVGILSGLYLFIYIISRGQWIGFGDVKLGLALALILGDWRLAFMALFLANLIGTIIVMPGLISGKLGRMQHIPFGPLLIAGTVLVYLFGVRLLEALPFAI